MLLLCAEKEKSKKDEKRINLKREGKERKREQKGEEQPPDGSGLDLGLGTHQFFPLVQHLLSSLF
jgi:hypothetical protein